MLIALYNMTNIKRSIQTVNKLWKPDGMSVIQCEKSVKLKDLINIRSRQKQVNYVIDL